jgi:Uma2 family endonuclease
MSTKTEKLTYEAWLAMPETKQRYEIVDGVLIMPPVPTPDQQWTAQEIFVRLREFVSQRHLGVVMMAPLVMLVQRDPLRTRQPNILYLNSERTGIRGRDDLRAMQYLEVPPDLVVEVLSPSNTRRNLGGKIDDYC